MECGAPQNEKAVEIKLKKLTELPAAVITEETYLWRDSIEMLSVHFDNGLYWLLFTDLATICIDINSHQIICYGDTDHTTLTHLILDQVIPRYLSMLGELFIHAGAVFFENKCFAFLGESGHGKSTLTASFVKNGAYLFSDDALKLHREEDELFVSGLYPGLRLWPNSYDGLSMEDEMVSPMAHYSSKRRISITNGMKFVEGFRKFDAIFVLNMSAQNSDVVITELSQRDLLIEMLKSSFQLDPTNKATNGKIFSETSEASARIKGYKLNYPKGFEHLPQVRSTINDLLKNQ